MRISPLGIFRAIHDWGQVADLACRDAAITHPHQVCQQANALSTTAVHAVRQKCDARNLYLQIVSWAEKMEVDGNLLEGAVANTVMLGGDTDTAICGAFLGVVLGRDEIPTQKWIACVLNCRPAAGQPHVRCPRPKCFWPMDAFGLAARLVGYDCSEMPDAEEI